MGSLIQFNRRAIAVDGQPVATALAQANEERRSLRILLWTFALSAIAMCTTVVFTLSPHGWRDLLWISSFMLVFALAKIALAQALFYIMINCDDEALRRGPEIVERAKLIPLARDGKRTTMARKRAIAGAASSAILPLRRER